MYLQSKFCENPPSGFSDSARQRFFTPKYQKLYQMHNFEFKTKFKNILVILFLHIVHMANFQELP